MSSWLRRAMCALGIVCGVWSTSLQRPARAAAIDEPQEVRALWVLRSSLTSPASIASLVRTAHDRGFNTLLVQVRGRGDAYYTSALEPRAADLDAQPPSFDPLATVLADAHASGIRVQAWITLNLVSSAVELPASRDHIIYQHPEWLMVPRPIAEALAQVDPANPGYLGAIARWTRGQLESVEGLYTSPLLPAAAAHDEAVVADIVKRYPVDGVHLDYARFPNAQFDYSRFAIAQFRTSVRPTLAPALQQSLDAQQVDDPFAYPDALPDQWAAFRRDRLTALIAHIRDAVRAERAHVLITAAVAPDVQDAFDQRLQDWRGWIQSGLVDAVCPMAYTQEPERFANEIAAARALAGVRGVWAGIGAYRLTPAQTIDNIQAARRLGANGIILFSYDSLTGPKPPGVDYLATVSRAAFGTAAADSSPK